MPNIIRGHVKYPERRQLTPVNHSDMREAKRVSPPWSDSEDAIIRKCYRDTGSQILAERLGRTSKAVQLRAVRLGVAASKNMFAV